VFAEQKNDKNQHQNPIFVKLAFFFCFGGTELAPDLRILKCQSHHSKIYTVFLTAIWTVQVSEQPIFYPSRGSGPSRKDYLKCNFNKTLKITLKASILRTIYLKNPWRD